MRPGSDRTKTAAVCESTSSWCTERTDMRGKAKAVSNKIWTAAAGEAGIRIRMYRVGFGDFFLLSFLRDSGTPLHIIIDCGVFKGTSQTGDIGSIEAAADNMADV